MDDTGVPLRTTRSGLEWPIEIDNENLIVGFQADKFKMIKNGHVIFRSQCGGGHRSCDFWLNDTEAYLVYVIATERKSTNLKHNVSSDESDIENKVAQSKRRANIEESDDDDSNDKMSSEEHSEPTGFLSKKKSKKKRVRVEQSDSSEDVLSDDFVVSDEEPSVKKEKNGSASSDSR